MKKLLFILFLFLSYNGVAGSFPITLTKGLIVSEAQIEGNNVLVILDTGAPGLVLNQKYYRPDAGTSSVCAGINGRFECKTRKVKQWSWLGVSHKKTSALVSDLSFLERALNREVYALIGLSVLSDYYVTIDFDQNEILLSKELQDIHPGAFSRFQYVNHLPVISCLVNGEKKILGLDTGSECNYLFQYNENHPGSMADASPIFVTGTDNIRNIKHRLPMNLEVDHLTPVFPSSFIVDLKEENFLKDALFDGLLGQEFLSQFKIIIHPGRQRILLSPREPDHFFLASTMP